jgi:hypothetical protein
MELLSTFFKAAGFEVVPATRTYTREDLIRVVIGQQWAVAITVLDGEPTTAWDHSDDSGMYLSPSYASTLAKMLAALPCAVDVVNGTIDAADAALEK